MEIKYIALDNVRVNPFQSRRVFDEEAIQSLASSIKNQGLINPITVRPSKSKTGYELVSGERRVRACRLLGRDKILAQILVLSDEEMLVHNLVENMEREDIGPIEEAYGYLRMVNEFKYTHEEIAEKFGKSRSYISNRIRLTKLDPFLSTAVLHKTISPWHALLIKSVPKEFHTYRLADLVVDWGLSVKELNDITRQIKNDKKFITWIRDVPDTSLFIGFNDHPPMDKTLYETLIREGQKEIADVYCDGTILNYLEECFAAHYCSRNIKVRVYFPVEWLKDDGVSGYPGLKLLGNYTNGSMLPPISEEKRGNIRRFSEHMMRIMAEEAL